MLRVSFDELFRTLKSILLQLDFTEDRASLCARLFAETSRDGVYSHGVNRFPRFVRAIRHGIVDVHASPELVTSFGALERWTGNAGPGNLNAHHCMNRAIEISRKLGIGCVALANTNHWMRGGSYGRQAADAGVIGICWTNTMPNLPAWGSRDPRLGNNPLIIAVPRAEGHVVLDMAMSQFSYGALESFRLRGEMLPVPGGFTREGELTRDPAAIEESGRPLPIGYWKGSGLSLMLDLLAAILSGGQATHQIPPDPELESGLSQVFIAINPASAGATELADAVVRDALANLQSSGGSAAEHVRYPGEQVLKTRKENSEAGIPVTPSLWQELQEMLGR
jgi:3-dehydro-L-gulonate 2-dehydrogenase